MRRRTGFQGKICENFWELSAWFQALSACLKELRESMMGDVSSILARCLNMIVDLKRICVQPGLKYVQFLKFRCVDL